MKRFHRLDGLLEGFVQRGPAGNACAVTYKGELVYEGTFGFADLDKRQPITTDTIYRIYSMTKVVTCTAALILYERGAFLLDDPLELYLPEFEQPQVYRQDPHGGWYIAPAARSIRVRDLFAMTSGLTYDGGNSEAARQTADAFNRLKQLEMEGTPFRLRELSQVLAKIPLAFDPGSHWMYGFSHDVLAAFIEVVAGKPFGEFLQEELFGPLEMKDTSFKLPADKEARLCSLYDRSPDGSLTKNQILHNRLHGPNSEFESGGAGLFSTLGDYSRFAHMLARGGVWGNQKFLSSRTLQLMASNHLGVEARKDFNWPYLSGYGYGLGVRVMTDPVAAGGNGSIGEFGWCGLAGTWVMIDPKEELSAVYMQQMLPNYEEVHQARIRNVIYSSL